jgi:hypothetical protein
MQFVVFSKNIMPTPEPLAFARASLFCKKWRFSPPAGTDANLIKCRTASGFYFH